jgi:DNA topoisomerase-1
MSLTVVEGLRYADDRQPGIRRLGKARFRYQLEKTGEPVRDRGELVRIKSLAVPPAWTDVWICPDPRGHLQATGRDARGRKQYRYHADHRAAREQTKFADLVPFGAALGGLRQQVDADLSRPGLPFERVVALVIALLEQTYVRVGNESYAAENGTFGLTTLRRRHVKVDHGSLQLRFVGKGGRRHEVECADPRLCKLIRKCQELGGQLLFEYEDAAGELSPVSSHDVNTYLRESTGLDSTAKTFRTWGATLMAATELAARGGLDPDGPSNPALNEVIAQVAARLGNTPAVCRSSYIHPVVLSTFEDGRLAERWTDGPSRAAGGLNADERRLLHLLEPRRRRRRTTPKPLAA